LQWLKSIRGKKVAALFSWKDPKPFLGDWSRAAKLALGGGKTKRASQNIEPRQNMQAGKQIIHNGKVKTPGVKEEMQGIVK